MSDPLNGKPSRHVMKTTINNKKRGVDNLPLPPIPVHEGRFRYRPSSTVSTSPF